jgi:hypothetical protein
MRERRGATGPPGTPIPGTGLPPKPSHGGRVVATCVLLVLWALGTLFAAPLTGVVVRIAETFEVALGLDVLPGRSDGNGDDAEEER